MTSTPCPTRSRTLAVRALMDAKHPLFIFLFVAVHALAGFNIYELSTDMISGDGSGARVFPPFRYGFMRVPETPETYRYKAQGRLGGDFAQVYFPSNHFSDLTEAYAHARFDPFGRPSRYTPFTHWLCALTICRLDYGYASVAHIAAQAVLFYLSLVAALRLLGLRRFLPSCVLLTTACLFCTPAGLAWFERGQFTLYVAMAYLWVMLGMILGRKLHIFISALTAYVKLTSFPFIFSSFLVLMLSSKDMPQFWRNFRLVFVFSVTVAILFALFFEPGYQFLLGVADQEMRDPPNELSLARLLPRPVEKALPLALALVGWAYARAYHGQIALLIPFFAGSAVILQIYPTLSYIYTEPAVLGLLPPVIYWSFHPRIAGRAGARWLLAFFIGFLIMTCFVNWLDNITGRTETMALFHVAGALLLLIVPMFFRDAAVTTDSEDPNEAAT